MEHTAKDCGCQLNIQEVDGHLDTQAFKFCPMHKAAPALLSALEPIAALALMDWADDTPDSVRLTITLGAARQARAAILAAKGD